MLRNERLEHYYRIGAISNKQLEVNYVMGSDIYRGTSVEVGRAARILSWHVLLCCDDLLTGGDEFGDTRQEFRSKFLRIRHRQPCGDSG